MSSRASSGPALAGVQSSDQVGAGGLLGNALRFRDTLVMSLGSSGPTQSIAVTLAALLATVGYASFLPLLICFIPMLGSSIGTALDNIVSTLGLMAAIFYLLTASAAVWYYRRVVMSSAANFFLGGFLPVLGGAFMLFVIVYTFSQGLLTGVEIAFGFGLAAIGLILSFVSKRVGKSPFCTDPTTSYGDRVEDELAGPPAQ